ncbi:MAG: AraC family transcriptional regulator ligand-binding domain-containing protein [Myxococcales bacterium]|nr:AraC family transcriptional regulator ligand-binding domain-containing protein [Myxococcales bacterium]
MAVSHPCYSVKLMLPYLRVLREYPGFPVELLAQLETLDPDDRMPIATVHELLRGAMAITGDSDIGLKAARAIVRGDYGAVEYAGRSAATWADALAILGRYTRLLNDALVFKVDSRGERTFVHLDSEVSLPRAVADYQSAAFYVSSFRLCAHLATAEVEVWFTHSSPELTEEYARTFDGRAIVFGAPFNGFAFPTQHLRAPTSDPDPKLHAVIRKHAEHLLAELPTAEILTENVRRLIANELAGGNPGLPSIAAQLHVSPSTLARRLEDEGTSFSEVVNDLRRRLALRYVGGTDLPLSDIALLLGFSQSTAFHRAFKRWTSLTPLEYRRGRRGHRPSVT